MGIYVNPINETKEDFLNREGTRLFEVPLFNEVPDGHVAVCLIDNGPFTAAGVCDSESELAEFSNPDGRRKTWFIVRLSRLDGTVPPSALSSLS